jgi:hypothetical protein
VTLRVWSKPKYVLDEIPPTRQTDDMTQIYREVGWSLPRLVCIIDSPYFQDDLEREIERLRGKLSRAESKKSSKTDSAEKGKEKRALPPPITTTAPPESDASTALCEICEQPGHDLFSCPILKDDDSSAAKPDASSSKEYCEDCESYDHTSEHPRGASVDGTDTRGSCQLSTLSRCILASGTTHTLLFPISRRSRFSARESLELRLFESPCCTLSSIFRIIPFENLVASNSALYRIVFIRCVANICLPPAPDAINAFPQSARVFTMSSPSRDVKPDVAELEQQASQEAPVPQQEKLNLTLSYGDQRESAYTPLKSSAHSTVTLQSSASRLSLLPE